MATGTKVVVGWRRLRTWHRQAKQLDAALSIRDFARSLPERSVEVGLAYVFVGKAAALRAAVRRAA